MMMLRSSRTSLSLLFLALVPLVSHAYPNHLQCFVPFDDDEVIMGDEITFVEDAEHQLALEVKRLEGDDTTFGPDLLYPSNEDTKVRVRIKMPEKWVASSFTFMLEITSDHGAKVERGLCKGKRGAGQTWDAQVTIKIDGTTDNVMMHAAWARGYHGVTMTHELVLWREGSKPISTNEL